MVKAAVFARLLRHSNLVLRREMENVGSFAVCSAVKADAEKQKNA